MKRLRRIHLLVGCLVAPLCMLFAISGALQVFDLHRTPKDGSYRPSKAVGLISRLHTNELFPKWDPCAGIRDPAELERCRKAQEEAMAWRSAKAGLQSGTILILAAGVFLNALTGIWMALSMKGRRRWALILVALGTLLPMGMLLWSG